MPVKPLHLTFGLLSVYFRFAFGLRSSNLIYGASILQGWFIISLLLCFKYLKRAIASANMASIFSLRFSLKLSFADSRTCDEMEWIVNE
jgi:hypothetical protein